MDDGASKSEAGGTAAQMEDDDLPYSDAFVAFDGEAIKLHIRTCMESGNVTVFGSSHLLMIILKLQQLQQVKLAKFRQPPKEITSIQHIVSLVKDWVNRVGKESPKGNFSFCLGSDPRKETKIKLFDTSEGTYGVNLSIKASIRQQCEKFLNGRNSDDLAYIIVYTSIRGTKLATETVEEYRQRLADEFDNRLDVMYWGANPANTRTLEEAQRTRKPNKVPKHGILMEAVTGLILQGIMADVYLDGKKKHPVCITPPILTYTNPATTNKISRQADVCIPTPDGVFPNLPPCDISLRPALNIIFPSPQTSVPDKCTWIAPMLTQNNNDLVTKWKRYNAGTGRFNPAQQPKKGPIYDVINAPEYDTKFSKWSTRSSSDEVAMFTGLKYKAFGIVGRRFGLPLLGARQEFGKKYDMYDTEVWRNLADSLNANEVMKQKLLEFTAERLPDDPDQANLRIGTSAVKRTNTSRRIGPSYLETAGSPVKVRLVFQKTPNKKAPKSKKEQYSASSYAFDRLAIKF